MPSGPTARRRLPAASPSAPAAAGAQRHAHEQQREPGRSGAFSPLPGVPRSPSSSRVSSTDDAASWRKRRYVPGHVRQGRRRQHPDQLAVEHLTPCCSASRAHALEHRRAGASRACSSRFIDTCTTSRSSVEKSSGLDRRVAAARLTNGARDGPRHAEVGGRQRHVVGDQEVERRRRRRRRGRCERARNRAPARVGWPCGRADARTRHAGCQAAAADRGALAASAYRYTGRSSSAAIRRPTRCASSTHLHRGRAQRHERQDVRGADTRVHARGGLLRSISSAARAAARKAASATGRSRRRSSAPCGCARRRRADRAPRARHARAAAWIASITSSRRPSLKLGTHSTSDVMRALVRL